MPAHTMKTYRIARPTATHTRAGSCAEAECLAYQNGWISRFDEADAMGRMRAEYVRHESGRRYTETRDAVGITVFQFEAGQTCFAGGHRVPLERDSLYIVRGGDWRGNPTGDRRVHQSADDWVDDFANHQARVADRIQKG